MERYIEKNKKATYGFHCFRKNMRQSTYHHTLTPRTTLSPYQFAFVIDETNGILRMKYSACADDRVQVNEVEEEMAFKGEKSRELLD